MTAEIKEGGLHYITAGLFLIAQMAGAGFLALPRAMADAGWVGIPMMWMFGAFIGFSGTRLGESWVILEERWPEVYNEPSRTPYMEIAYRSLGVHGRRLAWLSVIVTLVGATVVFMILTADMTNQLIQVEGLTQCYWLLIVGAILTPLTWLGTPKDFWQASVVAVIATMLAILVCFVLLFVDQQYFEEPHYNNPTLSTFSLGFGAILFGFGGASVFPTVQNDMKDRRDFWKSVIICFGSLLCVYFPLALGGFIQIGSTVDSNIIFAFPPSITRDIILGLEIINLLGTYIIGFNTIGQAFEDLFHVPNKFSWQRCVIRTCLVIFEILIGLAIPSFGSILNLIGGSTVTMCSFLFPPLMYIKLVDTKPEKEHTWKQRTMPLWERVLLWEIFVLGIVGGIASTVSAFIQILSPDSFSKSCFA